MLTTDSAAGRDEAVGESLWCGDRTAFAGWIRPAQCTSAGEATSTPTSSVFIFKNPDTADEIWLVFKNNQE
jgi:hypothetical protein